VLTVELVLVGVSFYLLWNIGANSSANALGAAVGSGILNFRQAVFITSLLSFLGAYLRGEAVMKTVGDKLVSGLSTEALIIVLLSSGLVITLATVKGLPLPATQGIVGSLLGVGLAFGASIDWKTFYLIVLAWVASPFISMLFSIFLYRYYSIFVRRIKSIKRLEILYKWMAIVSGSYIAFTLGTNDIANAVAPLVGAETFTPQEASIFGALCLSLGAYTLSYPIMHIIGKKMVELDPLSAFSAQMGAAFSISIANYFGFPVSSGQAVVGGIVGISLSTGERIKKKTVQHIALGWVVAPLFSMSLSYVLVKLLL